MIGFLTGVHIVVCLLLVIVILMQNGKGGGLAESFSSAENLLGAKTNVVMVKVTTVLCIIFFLISLALAILIARQGGSLMKTVPVRQSRSTTAKTVDLEKMFDQAPVQTITLNAEQP